MRNKGAKYTNFEEYIAGQPKDCKAMLDQIRQVVKSVIPEAEELISYQIPCFKYCGMLVGFGVQSKGCSFYTMNPNLLNSFSEALKGLTYSGSTIHFDPQKKLPMSLIKKIVRQRIKENEFRFELKKQTKIK